MRTLYTSAIAIYLLVTGPQAAAVTCAELIEGFPKKFDEISQRLGIATLDAYLGHEKGSISKPIEEFSTHDKTLVIRQLERLAADERLQQGLSQNVTALKAVLEGNSLSPIQPQSLNWVRDRIKATLTVIEKLRTETPVGEEKEIVFLEDEQMYFTTPVIFRTNYPGDLKQLKAISPSSRFSDKFYAFQARLQSAGYTAELVQRLAEKAPAPEGYPIVKGGTGNY